ncbi:hypothetical protein NECAME_06934 [Necator americanus]|uniref:Uncharacterized protein n=1 Tax=Necator americanus TaxID=51031 RepID=W2TT74_NECAM|nr:hypothetical protein NECAME_06934 [Necator americanus]ETN84301.1 hypothetical protein NECAME_06934 [Necator americanus]
MFYKPFIFVVDVVHDGIFQKADKRSEEFLVDDDSGSSLSELRGFFSSPCERKSSSKKTMVRSRIKLWYSSDIRQAKHFTDDDVVNFIMIPSTGFIYGVERDASSRLGQSDDVTKGQAVKEAPTGYMTKAKFEAQMKSQRVQSSDAGEDLL